jgi:hypothetical protein
LFEDEVGLLAIMGDRRNLGGGGQQRSDHVVTTEEHQRMNRHEPR